MGVCEGGWLECGEPAGGGAGQRVTCRQTHITNCRQVWFLMLLAEISSQSWSHMQMPAPALV